MLKARRPSVKLSPRAGGEMSIAHDEALALAIHDPKFLKRFWAKINVGDPDACWEWTGAKDPKGYGSIKVPRRRMQFRASRVALAISIGNPPRITRHRCDNPGCVNPAHLEDGTILDNSRDMVERGRSGKGVRHHNHKLDESQVLVIKSRKGESPTRVGREYGVTDATIYDIWKGRRWGHIE